MTEKFLEQEYPLELINGQFSKALQVDRMDLLFKDPSLRNKTKKRVVLTFNPDNPPVKAWINEGLEYLHQDPKLRKYFLALMLFLYRIRMLEK